MKWTPVCPGLLSVLIFAAGCQAESIQSAPGDEAARVELLRQMEEAHARLGDPEPEFEGAAPPVSSGLSRGDFARFEGERRCLVEHFAADSQARQNAEETLLAVWQVRAEWAVEQRRRLGADPKEMGLVVHIAQQHYEQVCPSGRPSVPFLSRLGIPTP